MSSLNRLEKFDRATWLRLEQVVERFENAWENDRSPMITDFLNESYIASPEEQLSLLFELACTDLEHRRRSGQAIDAEYYLNQYSELAQCPQVCQELREVACKDFRPLKSCTDTRIDRPHAGIAPKASLRVFGNYEDLQEISRGGMGIVYKARQRRPSRIVALKMIRTGDLASRSEVQRFRRETEAIGKLQHPNIVPIYEVGECDGHPFFTMEFVDGQGLDEKIRDHPLKPRQAARYIQHVAGAIHYAHQRGVVHRDIKPANILIDPHDRARVTDFGLARDVNKDSRLTATEMILGTPAYMPPEQTRLIRREQPGPQSDIYSLGATLYHLIVGRPPFQAASSEETIWQVLHKETVAPRVLNPKLDRDLETICLKCLQKEATRRYASAQEMADDLQRFLNGTPVHARPVSRMERTVRWMRRNKLATTTLALMLMLTVITSFAAIFFQKMEKEIRQALATNYMYRGVEYGQKKEYIRSLALLSQAYQHTPSNSEIRNSITRLINGWRASLGTCFFHGKPVKRVCISPDGQTVASIDFSGVLRFWNTDTGNLLATQREVFAPGRKFQFSPDSKFLICDSQWGSQLFDIRTYQSVTPFSLNEEKTIIEFRKDMKVVAVGDSSGNIQLWETKTQVPLGKPMQQEGAIGELQFSPDGKKLISLSFLKKSSTRLAFLWDVADVTQSKWIGRLTHSPTDRRTGQGVSSAIFTPDSQIVITGGFDETIRWWDSATANFIGEAKKHVSTVAQLSTAEFEVKGKKICLLASGSTDGSVSLWVMREGIFQQEERILLGDFINRSTFSLNGKTLLTSSRNGVVKLWQPSWTEKGRGPELCLELRESLPRTLAINDAAISADGKIIVVADASGMAWVKKRPTNFLRRIPHKTQVKGVAYSPCGKWAVTACYDGRVLLWDGLLKEGQEVTARGTKHAVAAFSPDSRYLITTFRDKTIRIWDVEKGAFWGKPLLHDGVVTSVVFSPDGKTLITGSNSSEATIQFWNMETGKRLKGMWSNNSTVNSLAISPNGKYLLSGHIDGKVRLHDRVSGEILQEFSRYRRTVRAVAFRPDGKVIATGGDRVRLWDTANGKLLIETKQDDVKDGILSLVFTPDGKTIISSDANHTVRLWDSHTGLQCAEPLHHQERLVQCVALNPDGRTLLTGSGTLEAPGFANLWTLPVTRLKKAQLPLQIEVSTGYTWDQDSEVAKILTFDQWIAKRNHLKQLVSLSSRQD